MRKTKKLLAVLLAMIMALSTLSAGMVAFAESTDEKAPIFGGFLSQLFETEETNETLAVEYSSDPAVAAVEKKIEAFNGNMDTATPTEADLKGYNDLIKAFTALTDAQKDSVDILAFDKLTQLIKTYKHALKKAETGKKFVSATDQKAIALEIVTTLNTPALNEAQKAVEAGVANRGETQEKLIELYKNLSPRARLIAETATHSNGLFYAALSDPKNTNVGGAYTIVANKICDNMKADDPFTGTRPNYKDYPDGTKDPQYKADLRKYNGDKAAHETAIVREGLKKFVELTGLTEYSAVPTFLDKAIPALEDFRATKDYKKAIEANDYFKTLPFNVQIAIRGRKATVYSTYTGLAETATSPNSLMVYKVYSDVADAAAFEELEKYEAYLAGLKAPYTLETWAEVCAKYDALPSTLIKELSPEAVAKRAEVSAYVAAHKQSTEKPDISGYNKTDVKYPQGASYDIVTDSIPKMDTLVNEVFKAQGGKSLVDTVNGIYTNAGLTQIAQKLFPMMADLMVKINDAIVPMAGGLASFSGDFSVAKYRADIDNTDYAGAKAALDAVIANGGDWSSVTFVNGDFFVESGDPAKDKEAFLDAFATMFRTVDTLCLDAVIFHYNLITGLLGLPNKLDVNAATFETGNYERIFQIFEILGIDAIDSVTYTAAVDAAEGNEKIDAMIRPLLAAVFGLIDDVAATPVTTLTELLPNLAMLMNSGDLNVRVQEIVDHVLAQLSSIIINAIEGALGGPVNLVKLGVDLSTKNLFNTIAMLGIEGITFTEETNSAGEINRPDDGVLTITLTLKEEETDEYGNILTPGEYADISIKEADFIQFMADVEGCGELQAVESRSLEYAYVARILPDKADVFVTLVRFVYDDVIKTNPEAIGAIVNSLNPEAAAILAPVVTAIIGNLPADAVIVALVRAANPFPSTGNGGDTPDNGEDGEDDSFLDKILDFITGIFGGGDGDGDGNGDGDNVDDPSIPNTAAHSAGTAVVSLAVLAGLGVAVTALKRKHEDE